MENNNQQLEPLKSPFSRLYVNHTTQQVMNCAMGLKNPIDIQALKEAFSSSIMLKHPRFTSLVVTNQNGIECWKKTRVNIDDHIVIIDPSGSTTTSATFQPRFLTEEEVEKAINAYLADISVSTPLSEKKPLWEIHVLMELQCVILRVHHSIGDGASLMAMLQGCFGNNCRKNSVKVDKKHRRSWKEKNVSGFVNSLWLTFVFGLRLLGKILWIKDKLSVISGGDGVELWSRDLVTIKFKLDDFKFVKNLIPSATINDVLLGVISSGLSNYIQIKSPKDMLHGLQVTGVVVVNLRKHHGVQELCGEAGKCSSSWGNKTGCVLQPIYLCNGLHPLDHVRNMKAIIDRKKLSYEAHLPYWTMNFANSLFSPKFSGRLSHRLICNTTLLVSNIMGPIEKLVIGDNPITFLRLNVSSLPHAMTIHMVSYGGNLDVQVLVAKDIIDSKFLAKCFQDSFIEMKNSICMSN